MAIFTHGIKGEETGICYIDSTKLAVCLNLRISRNKVFKGIARRGKTSPGWLFGNKGIELIILTLFEKKPKQLRSKKHNCAKSLSFLLSQLRNCSIGLRSGEYVGRNKIEHPASFANFSSSFFL
ncbi:MAG: transposase [Holosporales bacterium]|nr:transposase [Holosporales bacterium]